MNLFILRHAKAELRGEQYTSDSKRPLSPQGEEIMKSAAQGMAALGLSFDLILSSPYARAMKTAEITAEAFKVKKVWISQNLISEGDPRKLIEEINDNYHAVENILIAGHEPYLSRLISVLLSGNPDLEINFRKSALCKLSTKDLRYGKCAALEWFLTPRQLQKMNKR